MSELPPELAGLPPPSLVEIIDSEERLSQRWTKFLEYCQALNFPYDVEGSENDPGAPLLQSSQYEENLLRQRINEAIRSWFLPFASGGDIDIMAQWYDVARLPGEQDMALKRRVVLAIQGRSTGGTEARYRSIALGADVRVADAAVYTVGRDPTVHVAIFSNEANGVASASLLAKVNSALQAPAVRMVNDIIVVASAAQETIAVTANYWLLPSAPESTAATMEANLRRAWLLNMMLGRDPVRSWISAQLQVDGVQRIELIAPSTDIEMPFNRAAALGLVTLNKMGRAY